MSCRAAAVVSGAAGVYSCLTNAMDVCCVYHTVHVRLECEPKY